MNKECSDAVNWSFTFLALNFEGKLQEILVEGNKRGWPPAHNTLYCVTFQAKPSRTNACDKSFSLSADV